MGEDEIENVKEVVRRQQKLLHQLYTELEAEREASATAASEALSMILRLQREKASERLEASQFKRLIEEKMHHAEEVMDIFEDLMHQKEMHIASLEFQVQAYRYKLLSMGLTESDIGESVFDESMLLPPPSSSDDHNNPSPNRSSSYHSVLHRDDLPHLTLRRINSWGSSSSPSSSSPSPSPSPSPNKPKPKSSDQDLTSYMEQIKELDLRVKGLSSCATAQNERRRRRRKLSSTSPSTSPSPSPPPPPQQHLLLQHFDHPAIETESVPSTSHSNSNSTRIHDIFEVPQYHNQNQNPPPPPPPPPQGKKLLVLEEGQNRLGKPDASVPVPRRGPIINDCIKPSLHHPFINPTNTICVNCHLALAHPPSNANANAFHSQFQQLNKRLEKLEGERRDPLSTDDHNHEDDNEDEKLKLLKEIHEQLNTIKSEITTNTIPNKHTPVAAVAQEPCLVSLMEAMFFYSL